MKKLLYGLLGCIVLFPAFGDKPPIDHLTHSQWSRALRAELSADGRYAAYSYSTPAAAGVTKGGGEVVIQSLGGGWRKQISIANGMFDFNFTADGRWLVVQDSPSTLRIVELGTEQDEQIENIKTFKMSRGATANWLVYQTTETPHELTMKNLATGDLRRWPGVENYGFSEGGASLLVETAGGDEARVRTLHWFDVAEAREQIIWQGTQTSSHTFDSSGSQLTFLSEEREGNRKQWVLWHYIKGTARAQRLLDAKNSSSESLQAATIDKLAFGDDGTRIFISVQPSVDPKPKSDVGFVDVWSYSDPQIKWVQWNKENAPSYMPPMGPRFAVHIDSHKITQINAENEKVLDEQGDFALVRHQAGDGFEWNWGPGSLVSMYLVSLKDGSRTLLKDGLIDQSISMSLSPSGRYVVYGDPKRNAYFSYDTATKVWRTISGNGRADWHRDMQRPDDEYNMAPVQAWLENQNAVFVNDRYDIWRLDLTGLKPPVSITNSYGRKSGIVLKLVNPSDAIGLTSRELAPTFAGGYLLAAYSQKDKTSGFYRLSALAGEEPQRLSMGQYAYGDNHFPASVRPKFARNAAVHIIQRETASESPNFFWTADFRTFQRLSAVRPEAQYNWMTSELVRWKSFDGAWADGALYKPENFDPAKKYPLVLYFYQKLSHEVYQYHHPTSVGIVMDIAWLVSNGYLVFCPDIRYTIGETGPSAYNYVVSGAKHLASRSWVDAQRMAIHGGSFGGYQVNYIVTRTGMFAAAISGSGISDVISLYGSGRKGLYDVEYGQLRMGASLWQAPQRYIRNSPIFGAEKVTTPLLLMNNKLDGAVPFFQGPEFFLLLRRLGKKVWMLQYDGAGHIVFNDAHQLDLAKRMEQFFNHYLKDAPPPKWMTTGIPARLKGVESGLEMDLSGRMP